MTGHYSVVSIVWRDSNPSGYTHFQVAGITKPMSDVNPSLAEEALEELNNRITYLEMEQEDLKFKVRHRIH